MNDITKLMQKVIDRSRRDSMNIIITHAGEFSPGLN